MTIYVYTKDHLVADKAEYKSGVVVNDNMHKIATYNAVDDAGNTVKIHLMVSGSVTTVLALREWVYDEFTLKRSSFSNIALENLSINLREQYKEATSNDEFDGILIFVSPTGKQFAYFLGDKPFLVPVKPPYAGGYRDAVLVALGALDAGATAEEAVKIAVTRTNIAHPDNSLTVVEL